jgi:arsenical pump membrane protein
MAAAHGGRSPKVCSIGIRFWRRRATAVLSLDATIVLLTPIVFATAARLPANQRPYVYACSHLANSASLLLPVSNLTNLLAFHASGLSFARFGGLMALPWLVALAIEWLVFTRTFSSELRHSATGRAQPPAVELPVFALCVLAATLAGFVLSSALGIAPVWVAAAGARPVRAATGQGARARDRADAARSCLTCIVVAAAASTDCQRRHIDPPGATSRRRLDRRRQCGGRKPGQQPRRR